MKKDIKEIMRELAEYTSMKEELEAQIDMLKDEVKEYMKDNDVDEVLTDDGKATWREVISNRFDSTSFKKDFLDVYKAYVKKTSCKRFTFNR